MTSIAATRAPAVALALIAALVAALWVSSGTAGAQQGGALTADILAEVRADAAARAEVDAEDVVILRADAVTWADACLGASATDEFCAQALTDGFVIWVMAGDEASFRYHTGTNADAVRFSADVEGDAVAGASLPDGASFRGGGSAQAQVYTVQSGDTLFSIASRFGTTVSAIAALNNIANVNVIHVGQQLTISGTVEGDDNGGAAVTYTVQSGDTLFSIASRFGTTVSAIAALNSIANVNLIHVGQVLAISGTTEGNGDASVTYTVQSGDTLFSIAGRFDTTVSALASANNIANVNLIHAGQVLTIQ